MNEVLEKVLKTPIEIALGIDEQGMTTARKLYAFLQLRPDNFSRWCKASITENQFATENEDYFRLVFEDETPTGGKIQREDYKLTARFAKKLSMKGTGERAEQAREYFTCVEEKAKELVINRSQLSPELQMFMKMGEVMARQELEQKRQAEQLKQLEDKTQKQEEAIQTVRETFIQSGNTATTEAWVSRCINKIAESPNFTYGFGNCYAAAKNESYKRLTDKAGCRLDQKLRNAIERAEEKGCTKAQIKSINKLSVIMADKRLKEIYIGLIKEMMIAYCVEVAN